MNEEMTQNQLTQMFRNGQLIPERYGEYWSEDERELLRMKFLNGEGITEISLNLQRGECSVLQQLIAMGMFADSRATHTRRRQPASCKCDICNLPVDSRPCYCPHRGDPN